MNITTKANRKNGTLDFYLNDQFARSADLRDPQDIARVRAELEAKALKAEAVAA